VTTYRRAGAALLAFALLVGCTAQPSEIPSGDGSPRPSPPEPGDVANLIAATVQVDIYVADANDDGEPEFAGHGSGTILTADGLILTNAHVAAPDAPGQAVQYGWPLPEEPVERLVIRMTESEDAPPVERWQASVVAVDGYLDIAVIQVDATADGGDVNPGSLDLPFIPLGDSDLLRAGEPLTVVGFPGIGGDTVSVDHGDVSGFREDDHIGQRGWIKTSAVVHFGNSGGLAANAQGEIVGVPTRAPEGTDPNDVGGFQLLRPINLAMPVIEAAMSGDDYGPSPHMVGGSGQERVTFRGWGDPASTGCDADDLVPGYPSSTKEIQAIIDWSGIEPGVDILVWLIRNPQSLESSEIVQATQGIWDNESSGTCLAFTLWNERGFEDGSYAAGFFVGPELHLAAEGSMTIPTQTTAGDDEVTLSGAIIDAGNGQPISGALVFVLEIGTDIGVWSANPDVEQVVAFGESAADGSYTLDAPLKIGSVYPIVIFADGYSTWGGTLTVGAGDTIDSVGLSRSTS
jgi:S1-C subfamily serine protease